MCRTLKERTVKARKDHTCHLCGCPIPKGTEHNCTTYISDGRIYDFRCHSECLGVAYDLDMFIDCDQDEGLTGRDFCDMVSQYIYDNHTDPETDDVAADWDNLTKYEEVKKIMRELEGEAERLLNK